MRIGTIRYGWYVFSVYDDGSLASGRVWYEDPPTAARELGIGAEHLSRLVTRCLQDWAGDPSRGGKG